MPSKAEFYRQMAEQVSTRLVGSWQEWTAFLITASRLYKYPFHEQMMIYAQRPDATACAEYDLWNEKMGRYVRRGSKGIALVDDSGDRPRLRYVFDISDTGTREHSRTPWLWQLEEQHIEPVSAMLERNYGIAGDDLAQQLTDVAGKLASEYWDEHQQDFRYIVDGSFLEEYDDLNVAVQFKSAATVSIAYALMSRCGLEPEQYFSHEDFMAIFDFNTPATVGDVVRSGVTGMARWLLLVVVFVLVVAGIGVAYLYRSATPDMLPSIRVTFAGQTLEPSAYKWHVPVIGNWFKRTYAETYSSVPAVLEDPISTLSPDITISSTNYATQLTVTDANKETVFEGTLSEFSGYCFDETGTYTAKLVASVTGSRAAGAADITGSETWLFTFDIAIEPSVYLSENTIEQGGVAAIRVTGSYEDDAPTLTTTLKNQGFIQSSNGWVCYLPIPWNAALGTETIDVQVGRYSTTLYLKVTDGGFSYKDYSSQSQRATPYIGQDDAPTKVSKLFTAAPTGISWADAGFVQPFLNRLNTTLTFGATEYVGRRYSERSTNTGAGGRTSTNVILSTTRGELVIAPASGKIDLAEDLGGIYGNTVVIEHGAGLKSIFYGLGALNVKAGENVKQGQLLGVCSKTVVAEMRIGTVPINPLLVWRGQCDGLKNY